MSETWVCEAGHRWKHKTALNIPRPLFCPHCGNATVQPLPSSLDSGDPPESKTIDHGRADDDLRSYRAESSEADQSELDVQRSFPPLSQAFDETLFPDGPDSWAEPSASKHRPKRPDAPRSENETKKFLTQPDDTANSALVLSSALEPTPPHTEWPGSENSGSADRIFTDFHEQNSAEDFGSVDETLAKTDHPSKDVQGNSEQETENRENLLEFGTPHFPVEDNAPAGGPISDLPTEAIPGGDQLQSPNKSSELDSQRNGVGEMTQTWGEADSEPNQTEDETHETLIGPRQARKTKPMPEESLTDWQEKNSSDFPVNPHTVGVHWSGVSDEVTSELTEKARMLGPDESSEKSVHWVSAPRSEDLQCTEELSAPGMVDLAGTDWHAMGVPTDCIPQRPTPGQSGGFDDRTAQSFGFLESDRQENTQRLDDLSESSRPENISGTLEKDSAPRPEARTDKQGPVRPTPMTFPHVPGYEILDTLGRGGMGVVYKARHIALNRECALKMVLGGVNASETSLLRFHLEAEAVAQLQHSNIVQVYDIGEHNRQPYFSLEFVQGGTLQQHLKEGGYPPKDAADLLAKLARAVFYAHQHGIIHRDLKPANILLTTDGDPKITDFGLAKRLNEDDGYTGDGDILGTPTYMAPEQAQGQTREIGTAADVYALGAILYDLLTGRPPFKGETVMDTLQQVVNAEPIPPARLSPQVPRDLETICLRCLQKQPRDRYSTAEALAEDLERFLTDRPIHARRVGVWERMWKWSRRNPAAAALILLCVVGILSLTIGSSIVAQRESQLRAAAEKERQRAVERKTEAERQKTLADKHFAQAKEAVEEMLTRVSQEQLVYTPAMTRVRRDLLEQALHFYQKFLQDRGDSAVLRQETARAFQRVGDIQSLLGDFEAAEEAYDSAIDILRGLTKREKKPPTKIGLAEVFAGIGVIYQKLGKLEEAREALEEAGSIFGDLHKEEPNNETYTFELARVSNSLGNLLLAQKAKTAVVRQTYSESIQLLQGLVKRKGAPKYAEQLARVRNNLAIHLAQSDADEAQKLYAQARETLQRLSAVHRDVPHYRMELARTELNLGSLRLRMPGDQTAEQSFQEAKRHLLYLTDTYPYVEDYRYLLALTYNNLTRLYEEQKNVNEARKSIDKATEQWERLRTQQPKSLTFQHELAKAYHQQGILTVPKELEKGRKQLTKSIELGKDLVVAGRDEPRFALALAKAQLDLGIVEAKAGQANEAAKHYKAALTSLEPPKVKTDQKPNLVKSVAYVKMLCHLNLALLYLSTGQADKAKPHEQWLLTFRDSIRNPAEGQAELEKLARNWANLGAQRRANEDLPGAVAALEEALALQQTALNRQPEDAVVREAYAQVALELVRTHVTRGSHELATKTVMSTLDRFPKTGGPKEKLAAEVARCLQRLKEDNSLPKEKKREFMDQYGKLAVRVLREAVNDGFDNDVYLETTPAYDVLQDREDFQQLLEQLIFRNGKK